MRRAHRGVVRPDPLLEVKRGAARPMAFAWFPRTFPQAEPCIAGRGRFAAARRRGLTFADLLRDPAG